jgi:DNA-binding phage protein
MKLQRVKAEQMELAKDFNATVVSRVKRDPAFARALVDEALTLLLNGDSVTAKLILRDLVNATIGFESLAANLHKPSKSLHRMLSKSGNPTLENFSAVLGAIRKFLRVDVRAVVSKATA